MKEYLGFGIVIIGIIVLNAAKPPWQYIGLIIFMIAMFSPVIESLRETLKRSFKDG